MATIPFVGTDLVTVTPAAAEKLMGIMREKQLEGHSLRVFVAGGGCSGLQYGMTFDNETHPGDTDFESGGLPVRVDPMSAKYIQGATIDFVDSLMGGGFKIDNPNAVASCGCGHSFRPKEEEESEAAYGGGGCGSGCGCGH